MIRLGLALKNLLAQSVGEVLMEAASLSPMILTLLRRLATLRMLLFKELLALVFIGLQTDLIFKIRYFGVV